MRILLESEGAVLSIRNGGIAWESRLSAAHHKLSHIESRITFNETSQDLIDLWSQAEQEFHETLIDACGSNLLRRNHLVVYHQFRQQLITQDHKFIFVPENVEQHRGILDAALDRNETLVKDLIFQHLERNFTRPLQTIAAQ